MFHSPSILVYARDPSLLQTRSWLLERAGFEVYRAKELSEAEWIASNQPIDLLILCHSLHPEDCQSILQAVDNLRPEMKKLLVTAHTDVCTEGRAEPQLSAFAGPRALIATVKTILAS